MIIKNKLVVSYFNGKEISKAVEVGPGLNPMLRKTKNIHELIYIDLAHVKLIGAFNSEINFIETNDASEALRLVDKCDLIVANQLIEHLLYPNLFMQNCYQSLTEGGLLFIETPNFASREFELFKKNGNWGGFHTPKHFNIFSNNSLMNLCEKYGFKVVAHSSIYSPFLWSESIKNYLDNKKYFLFKPFFSLKNPIALLIYLFIDSLLLLLGKNTSNQRIILRK